MTIPKKLISDVLDRYTSLTDSEFGQLSALFFQSQPFVYLAAQSQDKEWFPDGGLMNTQLSLIIWYILDAAHNGKVPKVTLEILEEIQRSRMEMVDITDFESEVTATEIGRNDLRTHPQKELLQFASDFVSQGNEAPLVPLEHKAALWHADTIIRAFEAAISRQRGASN